MATLCEYYDNERLALQGGIGWNRAAKCPSSGGENKGHAENVWNVDALWVCTLRRSQCNIRVV